MKLLVGKLPSSGFTILAISYIGVVAFLFYGGRQPRLDRAFEILQRDADASPLTSSEVATLGAVLTDYPEFSRALMGRAQATLLDVDRDGWLRRSQGYLAVRPNQGGGQKFWLEAQLSEHHYPITVELAALTLKKSVTLDGSTATAVEFAQGELTRATIFTLEVVSTKGCAKPTSGFALRLTTPTNTIEQKSP